MVMKRIGSGVPIVLLVVVIMLAPAISHATEPHSQAIALELQRRGDLAGAEIEFHRTLEQARRFAGPRSVEFALALADLGVFYQDIGRFSQAESSFISSLKILGYV